MSTAAFTSAGCKPMNLALLGSDAPSRELVRAAAASGEHRLVWGCELGDFEAEFRRLAPAAGISQHWESLLSGELADGLIVARGSDDDQRADQLRKLVQAGLPMLVSHPVHSSMLVYYELDMIRRESRCVVLPYLPARGHPAVMQIRALLSSPEAGLGRLEQLVIERQMPDRTQSAVLTQFAVDIDLARALCGDLNKIGAMAPAGVVERYANLGVQLSGPEGALVRWSVSPVETQAGAKVTLLASGGKATLWMPQESAPWKLDLIQRDRPASYEFPVTRDAPLLALAALQSAVQGEEPPPNWTDACRDVELADSIDRSLAKGRTVEVYFEDYTEQGTFKGTMTSLGCGLLMLSLVLLPIVAIADRLGVPLVKHWAFFLLGIFVLFLLLQGLKLVFQPKEQPRDADDHL